MCEVNRYISFFLINDVFKKSNTTINFIIDNGRVHRKLKTMQLVYLLKFDRPITNANRCRTVFTTLF